MYRSSRLRSNRRSQLFSRKITRRCQYLGVGQRLENASYLHDGIATRRRSSHHARDPSTSMISLFVFPLWGKGSCLMCIERFPVGRVGVGRPAPPTTCCGCGPVRQTGYPMSGIYHTLLYAALYFSRLCIQTKASPCRVGIFNQVSASLPLVRAPGSSPTRQQTRTARVD